MPLTPEGEPINHDVERVDLERSLNILNSKLPKGKDWKLVWWTNDTCQLVTNNTASDHSPRLTMNEMHMYLNGCHAVSSVYKYGIF